MSINIHKTKKWVNIPKHIFWYHDDILSKCLYQIIKEGVNSE
ncbi:hypothetical protein BSI_26280 [Bacillus inaquosorum KCTC 13429]|uniref:Uncharacterized protein n=1 Tax=Bacillus inaquosorum KCTC 13429 TaxID=1236548 RepID=A0A9W5LI82_9BACI|nr:hypothetical protein BSI_26280 [Bacillus inaquosorum KCTC 13429]